MTDKFLRALDAAREVGEGGCARRTGTGPTGDVHLWAVGGWSACDETWRNPHGVDLRIGLTKRERFNDGTWAMPTCAACASLLAREVGEGGEKPQDPEVLAEVAKQIDDMAGSPTHDELVTQTEIARRLGVTPSAVTNWRKRGVGFPESVGANAWSWAAVMRWAEGRGGR